jgi:hypothetical protein
MINIVPVAAAIIAMHNKVPKKALNIKFLIVMRLYMVHECLFVSYYDCVLI